LKAFGMAATVLLVMGLGQSCFSGTAR